MKLSFWYANSNPNLMTMKSSYNEMRNLKEKNGDEQDRVWFNKEIEAGITHRINVPDDNTWRSFFLKDEIIHKDNMFYELDEERTALFVLTFY